MGIKYYIGSGSDWDTNANWSTTSGGSADTTVPGNGDTATFDVNSGACTIDATMTTAGVTLDVKSDYAATLDCATYAFTAAAATVAGGTVDTGTNTFTCAGLLTVSGGTFNAADGTLDCNDGVTISGGTFEMPSGTMTVAGDMNTSGTPTIDHNSGTIRFDGGGRTHKLQHSTPSFSTVDFAVGSTQSAVIRGFHVESVTCAAAYSGMGGEYFTCSSTGTNYYVWYRLDGSGSDPAPGGTGIQVDVVTGDSAESVKNKTITAINEKSPYEFFAVSNATTVLYVYTASAGKCTASANGDLTGFSFSTVSEGANAWAIVNLLISSYTNTSTTLMRYGHFKVSGDITLDATHSATGANTEGVKVELTGSGTQNITRSVAAAAFSLECLLINKSGGSVTFGANLTNINLLSSYGSGASERGMKNWRYAFEYAGSGSVDFGTTKISVVGNTPTIKTGGSTNCKFGGGLVIAANNTLTIHWLFSDVYVDGKLELERFVGCHSADSAKYIYYCAGDVSSSNAGGPGAFASAIQLKINGTGAQTITGGAQIVGAMTSHFPAIEVDKPSGTLSLVGKIVVRGDPAFNTYMWKKTAGTIDYGTATISVWIGNNGTSTAMDFGGDEIYSLGFLSAGTKAIEFGSVTCAGHLYLTPASAAVIGPTSNISVKGNIFTAYPIATGSTGVITLIGTASQTIYSLKRLTVTSTSAYTIDATCTQGSSTGIVRGYTSSTVLLVEQTNRTDFTTGANLEQGAVSQNVSAITTPTLSMGTITINKASGTVTLCGKLTLNKSGQDLVIQSGALDLDGHDLAVNDQIALSSTLICKGIETITATTKTWDTSTSTITMKDDTETANMTATLGNSSGGKVILCGNLNFMPGKMHEFHTEDSGTYWLEAQGVLDVPGGTPTKRAVLRSTSGGTQWEISLIAGATVNRIGNKAAIMDCIAFVGAGWKNFHVPGSANGGNNTKQVVFGGMGHGGR